MGHEEKIGQTGSGDGAKHGDGTLHAIHPNTLYQYNEKERALILDAYRAATVGESARLDRIAESDICASKSAARREAFKVAGNVAINLAIVVMPVWAFAVTGNPLPLALPCASVVGNVIVSVRRRSVSQGGGRR